MTLKLRVAQLVGPIDQIATRLPPAPPLQHAGARSPPTTRAAFGTGRHATTRSDPRAP